MQPLLTMKTIVLPILWLVSLTVSYAQLPPAQGKTVRTFGLVFDSEAYAQLPMAEAYEGVKGFSPPHTISLRPFCPVPADQGNVSACTAFAAGYGAMSIAYAVRHGIHQPAAVTATAFSAAFLYNQAKKIPGRCSEPVTTEACLEILKEKGNCLFADFDRLGQCDSLPGDTLLMLARRHRVKGFNTVIPAKSHPTRIIQNLQTYLCDSVPVIVAIRAYHDFVFPKPGVHTWVERQGDALVAQHALVVIGYDDTDQTFEVMSSWGTEWADSGFCKIGYLDMGDIVLGGYVLATDDRPIFQASTGNNADFPKPLPTLKERVIGPPTLGRFTLEGTFQLMRYDSTVAGDPFVTEPVSRDTVTQLYYPARGIYPVGLLYQLHSFGTGRGKFIYVFSADAKGKVQLHYPRRDFSPINPGAHARIVIPGLQSALRVTYPGDDFVAILYSETAIDNINIRLQQIKGYDRLNLMSKLQEAFSDVLIHAGDGGSIQYASDRMAVQAHATTEQPGVAVLMVLCLKAH